MFRNVPAYGKSMVAVWRMNGTPEHERCSAAPLLWRAIRTLTDVTKEDIHKPSNAYVFGYAN